MNKYLGNIITGLVTDKNEKAVFVQKSGVTYQLVTDSPEEYTLGDTVEGFAYVSKKDQYKMTTTIPASAQGKYGWGTVVQKQYQLGVFVDIGLEDKDIVVSLDSLPSEKNLWPNKGDHLLLTIEVDDQERMWGRLADDQLFQDMAKKGSESQHNDNVTGIVYNPKLVGTHLYTEDGYIGFVHPSEREKEPRLGEKVDGRVIGVREDGQLNVSLLPRAHEVLEEDAAMILEVIKRSPDYRIPFTDKSKPEEIKKQFGISKAQFKRSVGRLMKNRLVRQEGGYTILNESEAEKSEE